MDLQNQIPVLPPNNNNNVHRSNNIPVPGVHFGSVPGGSGGGSGGADEEVREQDRYLPVANIARIMKRVLPPNEKIAKDAKESVQECVSEFIAFITSEASDRCQAERRKTINGEDILWAIGHLGFDDYNGPLKTYLQKYRQAAKGDKPDHSGGSSSKSSNSQSATEAPNYAASWSHLGSVAESSSSSSSSNKSSKQSGYPSTSSSSVGTVPQQVVPKPAQMTAQSQGQRSLDGQHGRGL